MDEHDPHHETPDEEFVDDDPAKLPSNVAGTLAYVLSFASGIVFLLVEPHERFVRFHAFQSILLGAVVLILQIGIWILGLVPPLGWFIGDLLRALVGLAWIILTIFLMVKAYGGEEYQLPYLGPRARRLVNPY